MPIEGLNPEQLRRVCRHEHFTFETTAELNTFGSIIGQPRGTRAIEFGIGIRSQGFNIYVLGDIGTGRITAIRRFLREKTKSLPAPPDWLYVHNFSTPHRPRAIRLPPGQGAVFKSEINLLLESLQADLPKAFDTEAYQEAIQSMTQEFEGSQAEMLNALEHEAARDGFTLVNTASGLVIAPMADGKVLPPEAFRSLPLEERQVLQSKQQTLSDRLNNALEELRSQEDALRQQFKELNREVAGHAIEHHFSHLSSTFQDHEEVRLYLDEVRADVLENLNVFAPTEEDAESSEEFDWRRYQVNLFVDNSETIGAPVIFEDNPTYHNLLGRMEYEMQFGLMSTHFMNLKAGSLQQANGGYLVIYARDILLRAPAWEALKRAITGREIRMQTPETQLGAQVLAKSLDPEPIPLNLKTILLGSAGLYYTLYEQEEDFGELFKVKADFDTSMPRTDENEYEYALFISSLSHEEGLRHFDSQAVEKVVEFSSRLAEDQDKLSTRFGTVADVVREASYWAGQNERSVVSADDVRQALNERTYRANMVEEHLQEQIEEGTVFIDTSGEIIGQVNGLSIYDLGDYAFGTPNRITARTYMGDSGVVNIEREVDLAGPIHNKGLLTLNGYLGGTYAQEQPLSLSASLTFEQNYGGVDGDSASSTELYALLSSIGRIPLKQGIAVTGSINQRGQIQPIGGASEKIEGFFRICQARGLDGQQGVMIPAANIKNLILDEAVIDAVREGQFHIWAVETIDQGLELLTGRPAGQRQEDGTYPEGTVHHAVQERLLNLAHDLKSFGDKGGDEEE